MSSLTSRNRALARSAGTGRPALTRQAWRGIVTEDWGEIATGLQNLPPKLRPEKIKAIRARKSDLPEALIGLLDEYVDIERDDYEIAEEYWDAREEAWTDFVNGLLEWQSEASANPTAVPVKKSPKVEVEVEVAPKPEPTPVPATKRDAKLSGTETETHILWNRADTDAEVYTEDPDVWTRLERHGYSPVDLQFGSNGKPRSKTYRMPKVFVLFETSSGRISAMVSDVTPKSTTGPDTTSEKTDSGRKPHREYTDEQRRAIADRLQSARALKVGEATGYEISLEQFRALRLRPGAVPNEAQLKAVGAKKRK